ncbi:hypothetical protein M1D80_07655 [Phyllobacteriaceae bacterium JZ32]
MRQPRLATGKARVRENAVPAISFDRIRIKSDSREKHTGAMPHTGIVPGRLIRVDILASIVMATTPLFWLSPPKQRVRRIQE